MVVSLRFYIFIRFYTLKMGRRNDVNIIYNTSLTNIFGVPHYAKALWKVVKERDIKVNLNYNLVEVKSKDNVAVFEDLKNPGKFFETEVKSSGGSISSMGLSKYVSRSSLCCTLLHL